MKLVIYRDKETNEIVSYHEVTGSCTKEALQSYNNNKYMKNKAEIVELDEIAEYFYSLKTRKIADEAEELHNLKNILDSISESIDDRLYDFDEWLKEEKGEE